MICHLDSAACTSASASPNRQIAVHSADIKQAENALDSCSGRIAVHTAHTPAHVNGPAIVCEAFGPPTTTGRRRNPFEPAPGLRSFAPDIDAGRLVALHYTVWRMPRTGFEGPPDPAGTE